MTKWFVCLLMVFAANILVAQSDEPDAESLMKLLEESPVAFDFEISPATRAEIPTDISSNYYHQQVSEEGISLRLYKLSPPDSVMFEEAESDFRKQDYLSARKKYMSVLEHHPDYATAMVFTGQTFGMTGQDKEAMDWYQKAIKHNFADWMAHWFLAETYKNMELYDEATQEICIALVLNRNHPKIQNAASEIFQKTKRKEVAWEFNAPVAFDGKPGQTAEVRAIDSLWLFYGATKAFWQYDTAWRSSQGGTASPFLFDEERNSLRVLIDRYKAEDRKKKDQVLALNYLLPIHEGGLLEEFILCEIWLRKYPVMAYSLSQEEIEKLAEYYLLSRCTKPDKLLDELGIFRG